MSLCDHPSVAFQEPEPVLSGLADPLLCLFTNTLFIHNLVRLFVRFTQVRACMRACLLACVHATCEA